MQCISASNFCLCDRKKRFEQYFWSNTTAVVRVKKTLGWFFCRHGIGGISNYVTVPASLQRSRTDMILLDWHYSRLTDLLCRHNRTSYQYLCCALVMSCSSDKMCGLRQPITSFDCHCLDASCNLTVLSYWQQRKHVLSHRFNGHVPGGPGLAGSRMFPFWILLELRMMEVVVTAGAIRRAKLQSNVTINKPTTSFYRPDALPVAQPTVSEHWMVSCTL